jgi:hypothetical protein
MKRTLLRAVTILTSLVGLFVFLLFVANFHARKRAESFIDSVRGLRVGQSTMADIQPILTQYGGRHEVGVQTSSCKAETSYSVALGSDLINKLASTYPGIRVVGLRAWGVSGAFYTRENRLCDFVLLAGQQDGDGYERQVAVEQNERGESESKYPDYYATTFLSRGHIRGLRVITTPKASFLDLQHASEFRLSCFTSFRGCQAFCEILPLVAMDVIARGRTPDPLPIDQVSADQFTDASCIRGE